MDIGAFHDEIIQPLAPFGLTGPLVTFNGATILYTWIALLILIIFSAIGRYSLRKSNSIARYTLVKLLRSFIDLIEQSTNSFDPRYFFFITSLFFFIFISNALVLIPMLEEPTKDLNTTFALSIISFLYVQKEMLRAHGLIGYISEYIKTPFPWLPETYTFKDILFTPFLWIVNIFAALCAFPLEVLSKLANILSLSLRLFGNIFGSSLLMEMFKQATTGTKLLSIILSVGSYHWLLAAVATPLLLIFVTGISFVLSLGFGVFESLIQAFVFSILTLTYITLAIQHDQSQKEYP